MFHYKAETWADQIVIAFLVDAAALTTQQAVLKECSYGPYRRVLRRIVSEEGFHMRHGEEMLLTLAEGTDLQRALFQDALDRWWESVVHFFGPPTQPDDLLLRWKIKSATNEELRDRYVQKFVPMLHDFGLVHDVRVDEDGAVVVELLPTFLGCPALALMARDVERATRGAGARTCTVVWRVEPLWDPSRITLGGVEQLASLGIAVATAALSSPACPSCGAQMLRPISPVGATACRAVAWCGHCGSAPTYGGNLSPDRDAQQ